MLEFKAGDWVTVGKDYFFTPGKEYEVFEDSIGDLYLIDEGLDRRWIPLERPEERETIKVHSPSPPEEIIAHGRTYKLQHITPHRWRFGQWARHKEFGVVFVCGIDGIDGIGVYITHRHCFVTICCAPSELTYICNAEMPK